MNQKPVHLSIDDLTQTRLGGYHAHWPVDPDTTARLDRVTKSDPYAPLRFRDRYRLNPVVVFWLIAGVILSGVLLVIKSF